MGSSSKATGTSKLARTAKNRSALSSMIEMLCHHADLEVMVHATVREARRGCTFDQPFVQSFIGVPR